LNALSTLSFFSSFLFLASLPGQLDPFSHKLLLILNLVASRLKGRGRSSNLLWERPCMMGLGKGRIRRCTRGHPVGLVLASWWAMCVS
jgi:hypothetical protein